MTVLFDINSPIPNRSHKSVAVFFPMKHLTGIQRLLEIEIRRGNLNHFVKIMTNDECLMTKE